jgi:hypothetical protein
MSGDNYGEFSVSSDRGVIRSGGYCSGRATAGIACGGGSVETTRDAAGTGVKIDLSHTHSISVSTSENGGTHLHDVNVTIPESGSHTHAITGGSISGAVGSSGSGAAFDNRPSYYALIYIIKMTAAGE